MRGLTRLPVIEDNGECHLDDITRLWTSVLLEAMRCAVRHGNDTGNHAERSVINSLAYFDSRDCKEICGWLGLEHEMVREQVHKMRQDFLALVSKGVSPAKAIKQLMGGENAS